MRIVAIAIAGLRQWGETLGPYLLLELVLPGGSLWALLYFLWHRRRQAAARSSAARGHGPRVPLLPIACRGER